MIFINCQLFVLRISLNKRIPYNNLWRAVLWALDHVPVGFSGRRAQAEVDQHEGSSLRTSHDIVWFNVSMRVTNVVQSSEASHRVVRERCYEVGGVRERSQRLHDVCNITGQQFLYQYDAASLRHFAEVADNVFVLRQGA